MQFKLSVLSAVLVACTFAFSAPTNSSTQLQTILSGIESLSTQVTNANNNIDSARTPVEINFVFPLY